ncbi:MAG: hypothetical protein K9K66_18445 [Desulfarculaceae bacterium]|nr:hypothetical protein [Desulfarculaceae bacterium]MCF8074384.1 hypothetical protein [Desulfarculaceae bacterium]MCF8103640.1 hypothetical protein [Desulfarculaceae bacterium]MCF8116053.1 hypothetical protein [Desulfarculaceae bacterium]
MTPDELAEKMRDDITIKISRKNYFTITYIYTDPATVAAVTNALAAFYVDSNLRLREQDAVGTARFLERELKRIRGQLDEWTKRIATFKEEHIQELPESRSLNIDLMRQARSDAYLNGQNIMKLRTRIAYYEGIIQTRMQWIKDRKAQDKAMQARGLGGGGGTSEDESSAKGIRKRIEQLRVFYTDDHPDIQRLLRHLKKAEVIEAEKEAKKRAKAKLAGLTAAQAQQAQADEEMNETKNLITKYKKRIAETNKEIRQNQIEMNNATEQAQIIQKRIDNAPIVQEQIEKMSRGYQELQTAYQKLHTKWLEARMSANMERTQRGEQFEVVDPAQVPESPFRPKVQRAIPVSLGLALAFSVGLALGLNFIDTSYTSVNQLERQTGLPVMIVVPALSTPEEISAKRRQFSILLAIYGVIFVFLIGLTGILMTGRGPALKRMVSGLWS